MQSSASKTVHATTTPSIISIKSVAQKSGPARQFGQEISTGTSVGPQVVQHSQHRRIPCGYPDHSCVGVDEPIHYTVEFVQF